MTVTQPASALYQHRLRNGLHLICEPVPGARSLAMTLLLPTGCATEPADLQGAATVLSDLIFRGCAGRTAREHCDALDLLGVQRSASVETHHLRLSATMIGTHLHDALPLLADVVLRPNLEAQAFAPSRELAVQAIDALRDEPQQRAMLLLRDRHYPQPLGRSPYGQRDHLEAMSVEQVSEFWKQRVVPDGAILAFAGSFDFDALCEQVEQQFGSWQGTVDSVAIDSDAAGGYHHDHAETTQVHLAVGFDAVAETDEQSILQRAAVAVLSGGMSCRLFTEVREKRGLCYAVYASYAGHKDRGSVVGYAGTTAPRAQETMEVLVGELRRLSDGIESEEFERAMIGMKSSLVMQGESTAARSSALANDQYLLDHPRTLGELAERVDSITFDDLNRFVKDHRPEAMTIVTIGPNPLEVSDP